MRPQPLSSRWAGRCLLVAATLILALAPASALAVSGSVGAGKLSPRLAALATQPLRGAPAAEQAAALGLAAEGPGSLVREGDRVVVDVRFARGALAGLADLRAAGARIVNASRRYQAVTVAIRPSRLRDVASLPRVGSVSEALTPVVRGVDCGGAVRSEGDGQLGAASARAAFGLDGSGVRVGILSDSFDRDPAAPTRAAGDVASGDLPGPGSPCGSESPVGLLDDSDAGGSDEGRAMAQIVHDLAPGAEISFASATASLSHFGFAANVRALRNAGADVLADDIFYLDEPFFQEGPIAVAIDDVTAAGATHFAAAGNDNVFEAGTGREIGSWEAPAFRDSGACPPAVVDLSEQIEEEEQVFIEEEGLEGVVPVGLNPDHCMDFDPGGPGEDDTFGVTVPGGGTLRLVLQWAEPWFGVQTDLDAFLLDEAGDLVTREVGGEQFVVGSAFDNVDGIEEPFEFFAWKNPGPGAKTVQLVVNRFGGPGARLKLAMVQSSVGAIEYPESQGGDVVGPTVFGHAAARSAVGVGAIRFNTTTAPEAFSSRGPATHYFGPVRSKLAPAGPIAPDVVAKPDVVATDGAVSTFFGNFLGGAWRFFGTSAAAPHAAAVAALMVQSNPSLSPAQVRAALAATARPVGAFGPNAVGAGMVDAYGAVRAVALPPQVEITERPKAVDRNRSPRIGFAANRPAAFACSLDGAPPEPCASPFVPPVPLADGLHGFAVQGTDAAGRTGSSEVVSFRVDTQRPRTFFRKKPRKTVRTKQRRAKVVFRFGSNEPDATFICKVDRALWRFCKPRLVRRLRPGAHVVRAKARDAAGNVDRTPAVYRFKVKRRKARAAGLTRLLTKWSTSVPRRGPRA